MDFRNDSSPADSIVVRAHLPAVWPMLSFEFVAVHGCAWPTIGTMLDDCRCPMVVWDARGTIVAAPSASKLGLTDAIIAESTVDAVLAPEALLLAVRVRLSGTPHVLACHIGGLPVG
jgi:hypothetical protein